MAGPLTSPEPVSHERDEINQTVAAPELKEPAAPIRPAGIPVGTTVQPTPNTPAPTPVNPAPAEDLKVKLPAGEAARSKIKTSWLVLAAVLAAAGLAGLYLYLK